MNVSCYLQRNLHGFRATIRRDNLIFLILKDMWSWKRKSHTINLPIVG
jgi:hypothetical protein